MHGVGRNAGALVRLSVCLLLRHQLPTVTGVFWFSSQEKVLGAICSGMQSCSVARSRIPPQPPAQPYRGCFPGEGAAFGHMHSKHSAKSPPHDHFFFARKSLLINSCGALYICAGQQ